MRTCALTALHAFSAKTMAASATSAFFALAFTASAGISFMSGPVVTPCSRAVAAAVRRALGMLDAHVSRSAPASASQAFWDKFSSGPHLRNKSSAQKIAFFDNCDLLWFHHRHTLQCSNGKRGYFGIINFWMNQVDQRIVLEGSRMREVPTHREFRMLF